MEGHRLAIGGEGSGTQAIVSQLLTENGITMTAETMFPLDGNDAADALIAGRIDGAFFCCLTYLPDAAEALYPTGYTPDEFWKNRGLRDALPFPVSITGTPWRAGS